MKDKRKEGNINCIETVTSCSIWDGPELRCLDICKGDSLNDTIYAIARKICAAVSADDFSTLSLQCLVDKLNATIPTERSLINILQLLIDNECKLADMISDLEELITDPNAELDLDMKCLEVLDPFGNPIPVTQASLNQVLINAICDIKDDITSLNATVIDLQQQIDDIDTTPYTEPEFATCLTTGIKPLSGVVQEGFQEICDFNDLVGTTSSIQTAISAQCSGLSTELQSTPGWTINPTSAAQSLNNLWIAFCNMRDRVIDIETNCCAPTCDKVKVGFITTFNDNQTVTLSFTPGAGTNIPSGFTDCGSSITISNSNGVTAGPFPITIEQGSDSDDIDVSAFQPGETLTFSILAKLCSKTVNCEKCYGKVVQYLTGCCSITNTSDQPITFTYSTTQSV